MTISDISINDLSLILFSLVIIISYFFDVISKKTGVPSVLILISFGILISQGFSFLSMQKPSASLIQNAVSILGGGGVVLIVLEAAIDLRLKKDSAILIVKAFLMAVLGLGATAFAGAWILNAFIGIKIELALLYTIPLSILSSAIILPSIGMLEKKKKDFMVYESSFSDIVGIIAFHLIIGMHGPSVEGGGIYMEIIGKLVFIILFSIVISYFLIYLFQKIKGHVKLFLLLSILAFLYGIGKVFHFESLILILIFGVILNNYNLFFKWKLKALIKQEKVETLIDDFKILIAESAFVIRTFFFVLFGFSIVIAKLLEIEVLYIGASLIGVIFLIRALFLLLFNGIKISPLIYLAPRGLITVLLFMKVQSENIDMGVDVHNMDGILLFVILLSCLIMMYGLIKNKKKVEIEKEIQKRIAMESELQGGSSSLANNVEETQDPEADV